MKIKLIIWDLDDTLWSGTLAENDALQLNEERANLIRRLNRHGVVSAICSKNDAAAAREKLEQFGLWDEFVFRRISFVPKGAAVAQILDDMHLQAVHTLFVDDNLLNLAEVKHALPDINVIDATSKECNELLAEVLTTNQHIDKSRVDEYRTLEARSSDQSASAMPRLEFLRSCNIRVCMVDRMDNLEFTNRIEEVINRTNQLNFLKSRVAEGSVEHLISDITRTECYSLFVWDNYGYHGLVGFAAVQSRTKLMHFAFSCRIMHMGIEQWMLGTLIERYPKLDISEIGVTPEVGDWINEERYADPAVRSHIRERETSQFGAEVQLRIMANCQSGALAHFSGLGPIAEFDNMPRFFTLDNVLGGYHLKQGFPRLLVYAPFSDYWEAYWPTRTRGAKFLEAFRQCATDLVRFLAAGNHRMLLILAPEDAPDDKYKESKYGVPRATVVACNSIFRELALRHDVLTILYVSNIALPEEIIDARHFEVSLLKKLAGKIAEWYRAEAALESAPKQAIVA